jgi:hypothetical protein
VSNPKAYKNANLCINILYFTVTVKQYSQNDTMQHIASAHLIYRHIHEELVQLFGHFLKLCLLAALIDTKACKLNQEQRANVLLR